MFAFSKMLHQTDTTASKLSVQLLGKILHRERLLLKSVAFTILVFENVLRCTDLHLFILDILYKSINHFTIIAVEK